MSGERGGISMRESQHIAVQSWAWLFTSLIKLSGLRPKEKDFSFVRIDEISLEVIKPTVMTRWERIKDF